MPRSEGRERSAPRVARRRRCGALAADLVLAAQAGAGPTPRRRDVGDLIVLDLYGSYGRARRAVALAGSGRAAEAREIWDALAAADPPALGRRDDALRLWRATLAQLDAAPEYNTFGRQRALAEAGLRAPQTRDELPLDWWDVGVPR